MNRKKEEWLTGILIGLIIGFLLFCKVVFAQPINSPYDAQRAERYLSENAVEIPEDVEFWAEYYGERYQICPEVIEAVCWVESRCTPDAQDGSKACKGLMQIKPSCHQSRMQRLNVQNIFSIQGNIKVGTDYLAELGGSDEVAVALTIYNGQSDQSVDDARNGKLSSYVRKVLEVSEALERAHGK